MPFADEQGPVDVVGYSASWSHDFDLIASVLDRANAPGVISIEHVGSTSVPGLAAKDVAHRARSRYGVEAEPEVLAEAGL